MLVKRAARWESPGVLTPLRRRGAARVRGVSPRAAESHAEHGRAEGGQHKSTKVQFWGASPAAASSPAASAGQEVGEEPLRLWPCFFPVQSDDVSWRRGGFFLWGGIGKREEHLNELKS